jgi:THO complex subunit 4
MKLDQSLDEILSTTRPAIRGGRGRGRVGRGARSANRPKIAAPVGGIQKPAKQVTNRGGKGVPTGPSNAGGRTPSTIRITGLPLDIQEPTLKDYLRQALPGHPIHRLEIAYGPNGLSRGSATVVFKLSASADAATKAFNGLLVDGKPMKVEIIIDSETAKALAPKSLSERIAQPKPQPKSAAAVKPAAGGANGNARGGRKARGRGGAKNARVAKKTAEELDSEMADYWESSGAVAGTEGATTDATNGAAQPAANGDATMDEDIL